MAGEGRWAYRQYGRALSTNQSAIFPATRRDAGLLASGDVARRSWAIQAHIAPRSWPETKIPSVAATRLLSLGPHDFRARPDQNPDRLRHHQPWFQPRADRLCARDAGSAWRPLPPRL